MLPFLNRMSKMVFFTFLVYFGAALRLPQINKGSWFWDSKSKNNKFVECKTLKVFSELSGCISWILVVWRWKTESLRHANIKNSVFIQIFMSDICFNLTETISWRWIKLFEERIFLCRFERFAWFDWIETVQKEVSKLHQCH